MLVRAARSFRHGSHSFRTLTPIAYRNLFYPSASLPSLDSTNDADFPAEERAHLSLEQFVTVRHSGGIQSIDPEVYNAFKGVIPGKQEAVRLGGSTPEEMWEHSSNRFAEKQQEPPGIHKGRTVVVWSSGDVREAYARLQAILRTNNVRNELKLAERHEKKGEKRRRLRSERWRRKFADEVRKKVKLVNEIRLRDRMWGARH